MKVVPIFANVLEQMCPEFFIVSCMCAPELGLNWQRFGFAVGADKSEPFYCGAVGGVPVFRHAMVIAMYSWWGFFLLCSTCTFGQTSNCVLKLW